MDRPIIFSPPMVRAILTGKKTVTRRIVKFPVRKQSAAEMDSMAYAPSNEHYADVALDPSDTRPRESAGFIHQGSEQLCPYGQTGDRLWLKEPYYAYGCWESRVDEKTRREGWHFLDLTQQRGYSYQFSRPDDYSSRTREDPNPTWWLRPSLFMPRRASRLEVEVTDVSIERLRDISDEQARAEGFSPMYDGIHTYFVNHLAYPNTGMSITAVIAFAVYWQSLNGADSWDENPWVWVVSFRRLTIHD